ncbi:hypothetical protein DCAR_0831104 [Daucus carota subsp. sativus]|uniref:GH16 domain-containing protein n=1 Tax=Daucus carota subsp. sativus TaxID=79200 RepID=A0A161XZF0_DAUCS|nr:hypothetical protein DCAR_0831104 [Daucus carota subsp. sativus]
MCGLDGSIIGADQTSADYYFAYSHFGDLGKNMIDNGVAKVDPNREDQLTCDQPNHDEIDFELLGNVYGQPYILQTNIFADGFDNREERIYLWFDPTKDFQTYSILWNLYQIVFMVDFVPIRTCRNYADKGVEYPMWQPMSIKVSL